MLSLPGIVFEQELHNLPATSVATSFGTQIN
jgi:hypothetical protein